jgi:hypothetical protein
MYIIKDYWEARDFVHYRKMRFLIPNLYRKENKKIPHASYRNRGWYRRYITVAFK